MAGTSRDPAAGDEVPGRPAGSEGGVATGTAANAAGRRIELVAPAVDGDRRASRIGLGLLVSLAIGFGPLRDAALGSGSFPMAIVRYLACLACSVVAVLVLGRLLDGAPPEPEAGPESPTR
jgi:hypothetical protein